MPDHEQRGQPSAPDGGRATPRVAIAAGGTAGHVVPALAIAGALRLPLVLTEADSHLGITNRLLGPRARKVFLAFPVDGREPPRYEVVGRPVPRGTGGADRGAARARFGLPADGLCLLVFGGSL